MAKKNKGLTKETIVYSTQRLCRGRIEVCPKCGKKGKPAGRYWPRTEDYIHVEEIVSQGLFSSVNRTEQCSVAVPLKAAYYDSVKEMLDPVIPKIYSELQSEILKGFYDRIPKETLIRIIVRRYKDRLARAVKRDQEIQKKCERLLATLKPDAIFKEGKRIPAEGG